MYDIPWVTVVIGWTIMLVSYSATKLKIHRCGGGIYTMNISVSLKRKWGIRLLMLLYIVLNGIFSFKIGFKDLDIFYHGFSGFFITTGVILFIMAIFIYIDARLTISSNCSWNKQFKCDRSKLIRIGIYGRIRHPEPLAYLIAFIASSFILHNAHIFIFALLMIPIVFAKSIIDEQYLRSIFPEYKEYTKEAGRFFLK